MALTYMRKPNECLSELKCIASKDMSMCMGGLHVGVGAHRATKMHMPKSSMHVYM